MTYTANQKSLSSCTAYDPPKRKVIVNGIAILGRIFGAILEAMYESRQRQAEREIARFVALRGGRVTDELEREIARRLFRSEWRPR